MQEILKRLEEKRAASYLGGGQERIERQHAKGKLTAWKNVAKNLLTPLLLHIVGLLMILFKRRQHERVFADP